MDERYHFAAGCQYGVRESENGQVTFGKGWARCFDIDRIVGVFVLRVRHRDIKVVVLL